MSGLSRVLLVEDDAAVREALSQSLQLAGLEPLARGSFVAAKDEIEASFQGVVLSDIRMPGRDGLYLLDYARGQDPDLPVILLTGEGDVPTAVSGIQGGAFAFLEKPCPTGDLLEVLRRALEVRASVLEQRASEAARESGDAAARMLFGTSPQAEALREGARHAARGALPVMVHGAPGTGTSKVAEVIHLLSPRATGPFVKRAAAGMTPDALAAALERAAGGSLYLDEIHLLPAPVQFQLSEALEIGAARVIVGTHRAGQELLGGEGLQAELFWRLDGLRVPIPSLAERPEDIPVLFRHYLAQACEQAGIAPPDVPPAVIGRLMEQDWPGNARALMNAAMRYAMGRESAEGAVGEGSLAARMRAYERSILVECLRQHDGRASEVAEALGVPRKTLYDKLARHALRPEDFRDS